jgi:hypothetical protein
MRNKNCFWWSNRLSWLVPACLILVLAACTGAPGATIQQSPALSSSPLSPTPSAGSDPTAAATGTADPSAEADMYIGGTITWTAQATKQDIGLPEQVQSVTGTADVVIHVVTPSLLLAERDTGNRYSYDYANNFSCPSSHEEGTLESQVGVGTSDDWDYSIATLNPGGTLGDDLHLQILMPDYCGPSMGGEVDKSQAYFNGFPDCEPLGDQLLARFDGVDSYVIDCDAVYSFNSIDNSIGTVTGHVSGTLSSVQP